MTLIKPALKLTDSSTLIRINILTFKISHLKKLIKITKD